MGWKSSIGLLGDLIDRRRKQQTINWNRKGLRRPSRSCLPFRESRVHVFSLVGQSRRALWPLPKKWWRYDYQLSVRPAARCSCRWHCGCANNENAVLAVAFIRKFAFDYETETYYFVHAGVDLTLENWRETSDYQKVWIENHSMKRRIIQANGSSLAIHQSMDCSMSQSVPKIFDFRP